MKNEIRIPVRLKLSCTYPLDQNEKFTCLTDALLVRDAEGGCALKYTETSKDAPRGTDVSIAFTEGGGRVTVTRSGEVYSHMHFEADRTHPCVYRVGGHSLAIAVNTAKLENRLRADGGGSLKLEYDIISGNEVASRVVFELFTHAKKGEDTSGGR